MRSQKFLINPRGFVRFRERTAGKKLFDTPLRDNYGRIVVVVVGIIGGSPALTDKLSLCVPQNLSWE